MFHPAKRTSPTTVIPVSGFDIAFTATLHSKLKTVGKDFSRKPHKTATKSTLAHGNGSVTFAVVCPTLIRTHPKRVVFEGV